MSVLFDPERAARLMEVEGINLLVASRRENVAYLSGVPIHYWRWGHFMHMLHLEDAGDQAHYFAGIRDDPTEDPFVVAHHSRVSNWKDSWIKDVRPSSGIQAYGDHASHVLAEEIRSRVGCDGRVGMELDTLPTKMHSELKSELRGIEIVDSSQLFWDLRAVKTAEEVRRLKTAYEVAGKVYDRVFSEIEPGMTLHEIYRIEMDEVLANECFFLGQHLSFGNLEEEAHHSEQGYAVRDGDVGFFDLQVVYEGYLTDFGRVPVLGEAGEDLRILHEEIVDAREVAASCLVPGVRPCDVLDSVREVGASLSPSWLPDGVGHGLGLECHEPPFLRESARKAVEAGTVVVIEICRSKGGVVMLLEDAGIVTQNGWQSLTNYTTDLIELPQ